VTAAKAIWIVEDDKEIREVTLELFEMEGYDVKAFANGREALDALEESERLPNLILLDLMMPVMDGWEFRRRQLADSRLNKIPVVVATADGGALPKAAELGATELIRKPLDIEELLSLVAKNS
jgi:CheY-like chemotaxis protein